MKHLISTVLLWLLIPWTPVSQEAGHFISLPPPKMHSVTVSRGTRAKPRIQAIATAYDISIESCGKTDGITRSGFNLTGNYWDLARTIAVDPNMIPLGTVVYLTFANVPQYNGVYVARDTGGAIKGNRIDVFIESRKKCFEFGRQPVIIEILGRL